MRPSPRIRWCRDTRHLSPEAAREVWVEAHIVEAALTFQGRPVWGMTITGLLFEPDRSDAARRLARYRAFEAGGTAGRKNFFSGEEGAADFSLRMLLRVAESDPEFRPLVDAEAAAERRRVWAP